MAAVITLGKPFHEAVVIGAPASGTATFLDPLAGGILETLKGGAALKEE
jgi:hypothetical protein